MTSPPNTSPSHDATNGAQPQEPPLDARLRAEVVRTIERDTPLRSPSADAAARQHQGDFESRLLIRARHLPIRPDVDRALGSLRTGTAWAIALGLLMAFVAGAVSVRAAMTGVDGTQVNFYWVLGAVLGVQSLLLVVWLAVAGRWRAGRSSGGSASPMLISLGRLVTAVGRWLAEKTRTDPGSRAALHAAGRVHGTGRMGFWTFSSITHALWLSFNIGALTLLLLLLSARQYTFVWETTILGEDQYVAMTEALSTPVEALGFSVPSHQDLVESQWTGDPSALAPSDAQTTVTERSQRWASLLVASIVVYGATPRIVLLLLSLGFRRRAAGAFRLDTSALEYERLRPQLMPTTQALGVVDPERPEEGAGGPRTASTSSPHLSREPGPPAIVGVELAPPGSGWPPPLNGVPLDDLGIVESRQERTDVAERLSSAPSEPSPLVLVCELTSTPDRGMRRAIQTLRETIAASPLLILTGGQRLRDRNYDADDVRQRVEDWRTLATDAGIEPGAVVEADLDHLTHAAATGLSERIRGDGSEELHRPDRVGDAFPLIARHATGWVNRGDPPSEEEQLELHRTIAALYQRPSGAVPSIFENLPESPEDALDHVQSEASRMVGLLPARLRRSRRWLGAGALAGALGCLATSAVAGPVALAALPSWSLIGGAVGAALERFRGAPDVSEPLAEPTDVHDAVRAAALFTLTLELQGRDEATITRVLDRTFPEDPGPEAADGPDDPSAGPGGVDWLEQVHHRFQRAVEEEAGW